MTFAIFDRMNVALTLIVILLASIMPQGDPRTGASEPPEKEIRITGKPLPASEAFFIGEVHGIWEGRSFIFQMTKVLNSERGIRHLAMEWSKSEAWMFNAYLSSGDTTIFEYYRRSPMVERRLRRWEELYQQTGITIHGLDFERTMFVYVISSLLRRHPATVNTDLYRYLQTVRVKIRDIKDDRSGKRESIRIYNSARQRFRADREFLQKELGKDYQVVADIMGNPARQDQFRKRDEAMATNLIAIPRPFLCVIGMGHTTLHKESTLKRYVNAAPTTNPVVVNMVCRNCFTSSYFRDLTVPMIADYEERNTEYMLSCFDNFYNKDTYPVIEQRQFKDLPGGYNDIPTYYVLFKDQPQW